MQNSDFLNVLISAELITSILSFLQNIHFEKDIHIFFFNIAENL